MAGFNVYTVFTKYADRLCACAAVCTAKGRRQDYCLVRNDAELVRLALFVEPPVKWLPRGLIGMYQLLDVLSNSAPAAWTPGYSSGETYK